MSGSLHAYPHADSSLLQVSIELLCLSITVVQFLFTTLTCLFHKKRQLSESSGGNLRLLTSCRLLSPEPVVVEQLQATRMEGPTLLCNHLDSLLRFGGLPG